MNVLDLFSGIGGFSLGLERAGCRTVALCEQSAHCRSVLRRHWPGVPCYDDIHTLSARRLHADGVAHPDLICGGFPCQDVSTAGTGTGLDGGRSVLWHQMLRLAGECRPAWVVVENVPALRIRGADRVLAGLEAAGYTCWPLVVGAAHAGAPHRRQRLFIVAGAVPFRVLAHTAGTRLEDGIGCPAAAPPCLHPERLGGWPPEPGLGRVVDGLPARLDRRARLTALGNAVIPDVATAIGEAVLAAQAAAERTLSANVLRNLATFGATTARQYPA